MRKLALALASAGALGLAIPVTPAAATIETPEAKMTAASAADLAKEDMRATFGKTSLKNGHFLWKDDRRTADVTRVVVSLSDQLAFAYQGHELIGVSTISSGKAKTPTPTGIFPILEKKRHHKSRKYDDAPMPYMQRLDRWGIALHGGHLPGHPASHGCIRLPHKFAAKLFAATDVGTHVLIGA